MPTRKQMIIHIVSSNGELSCAEICVRLIAYGYVSEGSKQYLSGSVSSILAKLVKENILEYSFKKSIRGGHIYKMKK